MKNPLIAGANDLTANIDDIRRIEEAGAGATVPKSLFEEQVRLERFKLAEDLSRGEARYAEMVTPFPKLEHAGPKEHLLWVREAKAAVKVPAAVKLSPFYTNPLNFVSRLDREVVDGLELFNRMSQPDIDGERESIKLPFDFSHPVDSRLPSRFAGLLLERVKADLGAWMDRKGCRKLDDFRGDLSGKNAKDSWAYARA